MRNTIKKVIKEKEKNNKLSSQIEEKDQVIHYLKARNNSLIN